MSKDRDFEDSSPAGLWEAAKDLMRWLFAAYGRPVDIAAMGPLTAKEHREIASWLVAVERIARRLLVVEAGKLVKTLPAVIRSSTPPSAPRTTTREKRLVEQDLEDPSRWRVSFRVPMARTCGGARQESQGSGLKSAWPLAERIEAARRVLNDPAPYVLRLARRLRGEPQRAAAIVQPERGSERETLGRWAYARALEQARETIPAFDTS
ncbi:MAG: hypothetical protein PVI23_16045 [Maricaulaceae bacterium]|jgi:hypothetical protein